jgi:hypothetical protein
VLSLSKHGSMREPPFDKLRTTVDPFYLRADMRGLDTGTTTMRFGVFAAACLFIAAPLVAADDVDNGSFVVTDEQSNSAVPAPSEEALIFTGQDEKPLTPARNGFREGVDNVVAGAKAFSSWMGPEIWLILIGGFGLVGFAVRRSERVLRFEPRREGPTDRTGHPEDQLAASAPDASTPPHSDNGPAPSARRGQAE